MCSLCTTPFTLCFLVASLPLLQKRSFKEKLPLILFPKICAILKKLATAQCRKKALFSAKLASFSLHKSHSKFYRNKESQKQTKEAQQDLKKLEVVAAADVLLPIFDPFATAFNVCEIVFGSSSERSGIVCTLVHRKCWSADQSFSESREGG